MLTFASRCIRSALSRHRSCACSIATGLLSLSLSGCGSDSPPESAVAQNDAAPPSAAPPSAPPSSAPERSGAPSSGSQPGSSAGGYDSSNMSADYGSGGYPGADGGGYPGGEPGSDGTDPAMTEGYGQGGSYPGAGGSYPGADGSSYPGGETDSATADAAQMREEYGQPGAGYPGSGLPGESGVPGDPTTAQLAEGYGRGGPGGQGYPGGEPSAGTDPTQMQQEYGRGGYPGGGPPGSEGIPGGEGIPGEQGGYPGGEGYGGPEGAGGGGASQAPPADSPVFPAYQLVMGLMQGKYEDMNKYVSARAKGQLQKIGAGKLSEGEKAELKKTFAQPQLAGKPRNTRVGHQIVLKSDGKTITILAKKEGKDWKVAEMSIREASRR